MYFINNKTRDMTHRPSVCVLGRCHNSICMCHYLSVLTYHDDWKKIVFIIDEGRSYVIKFPSEDNYCLCLLLFSFDCVFAERRFLSSSFIYLWLTHFTRTHTHHSKFLIVLLPKTDAQALIRSNVWLIYVSRMLIEVVSFFAF